MTIALRRSRALLLMLALAHAAALGLLWPLATPLPLKLLLLAAIASSAWRTWRRMHRPAARALHLRRDGILELTTAGGERKVAHVLGQTTVLPSLVVLLLRLDGRLASLALPLDAMTTGEHRQLRLWLNWLGAVG